MCIFEGTVFHKVCVFKLLMNSQILEAMCTSLKQSHGFVLFKGDRWLGNVKYCCISVIPKLLGKFMFWVHISILFENKDTALFF